jgi:hypothetical protein
MLRKTTYSEPKALLRLLGISPARCLPQVSRPIVRAEHWDVLQDEVTRAESQSGLPMFGKKFPE